MLMYVLPVWVVTLVSLWGFMLWDKHKAIKLERHYCTGQIVEALNEVTIKSDVQVDEAIQAAANFVIPDDITSLCKSDKNCRDK